MPISQPTYPIRTDALVTHIGNYVDTVDPWMQSAAVCDNGLRFVAGSSCVLTSGTLQLVGGFVIPANQPINTVTFFSGSTAAGTPTNQWACLVDLALNVLVKSADQTTGAWTALTYKTFTLASAYTPTVNTPVYAGIVVTATTPPDLRGASSSGGIGAALPRLNGNSTSGLTNPASLGSTAAAPSALGPIPYGFLA
jgi:hypothetical protein